MSAGNPLEGLIDKNGAPIKQVALDTYRPEYNAEKAEAEAHGDKFGEGTN